jgi:murein DD-endopeptidase MepM/ murein hydrolase activator NlpD
MGRRMRTLPTLAAALGTLLLIPAAGASTGGTSAPPEPPGFAGAPGGSPGGAEYGVPLRGATAPAPVARAFRLTPARVTAPALPEVRLRVDQRGSRTVAANVVFSPVRGGAPRRLDLGLVVVGRTITVRWPAGFAVAPGRYLVRLHVIGRGGRVLARRAARAVSGRATLTVARAPRRRAPAPAPAPPVAPLTGAAPTTTPAATPALTSGVFPVRGPHSYGDGFGAPRSGHLHQGADVLAAEGTPVVSPLAGTVRATAVQPGGAGWYVVLHADDGRDLFFAHCRAHTIVVSAGVRVAPGTPLCQVGHTGDASGPHLHLEIWVGGWRTSKASAPIDPTPQLRAWDR